MTSVEVHRIVVDSPTAAIVAQFSRYAHLNRAGFYAVVVGACTDGRPVVVATEDLRPSPRWEFRTSGLWAEQVREQPTEREEHWSYGLEAFAIGIDDATELLGRGFGDRCALGWELDVFTPVASDESSSSVGRATGILLYENLELDLDGVAERHYWMFESADVTDSLRDELLFTTINNADQPTVIVPTAVGAWTVAISARPVSG